MRIALLLVLAFSVVAATNVSYAIDCNVCHDMHGPDTGMHTKGVAQCNICHTMHNSQDGTPVDPDSPNGNEWLLRDATPSDVCLSCHAGYVGSVFGDDPLNPPTEIGAGNFVFLLEDNLNDGTMGRIIRFRETQRGTITKLRRSASAPTAR